MKLAELHALGPVAIQCHDDPDADALASGFALYHYFAAQGETPLLFYGGEAKITKPNLSIMCDELGIPAVHRPDLKYWKGLLITVDCIWGNNNVQRVEADTVAVIDHHPTDCPETLPPLHILRPELGSCCTLVWHLLLEAGFRLTPEWRNLAMALYYGLYMDTNSFAEMRHPLDLNMRDALMFLDTDGQPLQEESVLKRLLTSRLSVEELEIAAAALHHLQIDRTRKFALVEVAACDPNLLGFISDLANEVAGIEIVLAWTPRGHGWKFSARTSGRVTRARDLTLWLTRDGAGSGGGHKEKAGGWLSTTATDHPATFFRTRLNAYLDTYHILDCQQLPADIRENLHAFRKREVTLGFVPSTPRFRPGARLQLRMLEGDLEMTAGENVVILIGLQGEVYPVTQEIFHARYQSLNVPYVPAMTLEYPPTVSEQETGEQVSILDVAIACRTLPSGVPTEARQLVRPTKVFPARSPNTYFLGESGDWLVVGRAQNGQPPDLYIIKQHIFPLLYEAV